MSTGIGSRGPYAKTAAVRARIIEAALAVFAESGFRASTMKQIAARAEISERGLVHHFPSKDHLLFAALADREEARAAEFTAITGARGLRELADFIGTSREPVMRELQPILAAEATAGDHPAHDYYQERYAAVRDYLAREFDAARANGDTRVDLDAATFAAMFVAVSDSSQQQWLFDHEAVDPGALLHHFLDMVLTDRDG